MPELRHTLPGTTLPQISLSPVLLFHRWQAYDRFEQEPDLDKRGKQRRNPKTHELQWLDAFGQVEAKRHFLRQVADVAQAAARKDYAAWHARFAAACTAVRAEEPLRATTVWRLVAGWGTNPAFETGLSLDHFLGFPFIPGSAVKGLLHRVAELELLEDRDGGAIPQPPPLLPEAPPPELHAALARCRRVRALFGSLHLRRRKDATAEDPEAPFDRLAAWRAHVPDPGKAPPAWKETADHLARLCSEAPAGGMVTCFDAVPAPEAYGEKERPVLAPDVLTPHTGNKPNPIPFLAVREGVPFELRYRLAGWPAAAPRDSEERERAADLGDVDRAAVAADLRRWLVRGLAELGLGGKTSAGYGYLVAEGAGLPDPRLLPEPPLAEEPAEEVPESERLARQVLADEIDAARAVDALDKALRQADLAVQSAVAARFAARFPETLARWRTSKKPATKRRLETIDRLLARSGEDGR